MALCHVMQQPTDAEVFEHRKNPNGCPIHATFYISHEYNNYQYVQKLWNGGHEIAAHSIT